MKIKKKLFLLVLIFSFSCISFMCGKKSKNPTVVDIQDNEENVKNQLPIADAGLSQKVEINTLVTLNGSGSSDPDGDTLTYVWSFISKPNTSRASNIK